MIVILIVAGGAVYLYLDRLPFQSIHTPDTVGTGNDNSGEAAQTVPFYNLLYTSPKSGTSQINLTSGTVIIRDIVGDRMASMPGIVSDSGWVAIPAKLCVGGVDFRFHALKGEEFEIIGGIIGDRDEVGIWQLKAINQFPGRQLFPAKPDKSLIWVSIDFENRSEAVKPVILSEQQNLYHIALPESIQGPGVLLQDDKIVGWTFGKLLDGGYLWKGPDERNLVYELGVTDFYRLTFENSREEQFIIAYSKEGTNPVRQLEIFANGFRLESMLSDQHTASHLKAGAVISKMRSIISELVYSGNADGVAVIFDARILAEAGDVPLLTDVTDIVKDVGGYAAARDILEEVLDDPENFNDRQIDQIKSVLKTMYHQWLLILMNDKNYAAGVDTFNRSQKFLGEVPEIQLMGVRLALSFNDWRTAERLLSANAYPSDVTGQVNILKEKIMDLKNQEAKIIVRFSPGSSQIPVSAFLNNEIHQTFIVDTGASTITIPTATAEKLGLNRDGSAPIQKLVTAGGLIEAPRVTLDTIELDGWIEYDVMAFILDMPNQSGLGLLGLNYLNRFRMDLNTKSGMLILNPR